MQIPFFKPFPNALTVNLFSFNELGVWGGYGLHVRNMNLDKGDHPIKKRVFICDFRVITAFLDHGSFPLVEN